MPLEEDTGIRDASGAVRWAPDSAAIHVGRPHQPGSPLNVPIEFATSFVGGGDYEYSRAGNRTWEPVEYVMAALESPQTPAYGLSFGAGISVLSAVLDVMATRVGGPVTVVAPNHPYAGTIGLLMRQEQAGQVVLRTVQIDDPAEVAAAMPGAHLVWLESPTNPAMEVCDIAAAAEAGHAAGAVVVCDNTFATPLVQRPLELGCDIVMHSASKYIGGHSDILLGIAVTQDKGLAEDLWMARTANGLIPGVMESWLAARGVRTMTMRVRQACANAAILAERLAAHPGVRRTRYPLLPDDPGFAVASRQMHSGGAIVCFEPAVNASSDADADGAAGEQAAVAAADRIVLGTRLWTHATSLGGVESTLERRRRHEYEPESTPPALIRLSVGCEDVEDLWADLAAAIEASSVG